MTMENIIYRKEEHIARITLNRPDVLNALNPAMALELKEALEDVQASDIIKVVIVNGAGRAFSAGVDIKATSAEGFQKGEAFMEVGQQIGQMLMNMPQVTIAQVHGFCFTGSLEIMMFFDLAYCAKTTQFGDTHAKWAIMPRWGMSQRLARRVGLEKAKELTFRAMRISGAEAERINLVNGAFDEADLSAEVNKIAQDILGNSFEAIAAIKQLYNQGFQTTLKEGLQIELSAESKLNDTAEKLKGFKK